MEPWVPWPLLFPAVIPCTGRLGLQGEDMGEAWAMSDVAHKMVEQLQNAVGQLLESLDMNHRTIHRFHSRYRSKE